MASLYAFGDGVSGEYPSATMVQAPSGDLYGTTPQGGAGFGTVFKTTVEGSVTTLHFFEGSDGDGPWGLMLAANGDLYGVTYEGGAYGQGTIFQITVTGELTTLYNFCSQTSCTDGAYPYAALVQGNDGIFYGTAGGGGAHGDGVVFKMTPAGVVTTLHSFDGTDGNGPFSGLVLGSDGNFYGTTLYDGASTGGSIFKMTPAGTLTTLHDFDGADGSYASGTLLQATNGTFYGTTGFGGSCTSASNGCGTVFGLDMRLRPFVATRPTFGGAGTTVVILGNSLTGTTSVSFNGTAAAFAVVSGTEITATVPVGASTGTVQVITPSGTLNSNVQFHVSL